MTLNLQIFAALFGSLLTLIARPLIWFESINEPTKLARTKVFILGSSQPSPSKDLVPIITLISPLENNLQIKDITLFLKLFGTSTIE